LISYPVSKIAATGRLNFLYDSDLRLQPVRALISADNENPSHIVIIRAVTAVRSLDHNIRVISSMENENDNNSIKSVRRQPTPPDAGVSKAPGTVPPASFYASSSSAAPKPPPLPLRPKNNLGSAHTKVNIDPPPAYDNAFREPQLVSEDTIGDDQVPALIPAEDNSSWTELQPKWNDDNDWNKSDSWSGPMPWDSTWATGTTQNVVDIDGRDQEEETNWWDTEMRDTRGRPGSGMLPPLVAERLHDPEHSLFSVSVTMPDTKPSTTGEAPPPLPFVPPSHDEVRRAVPHANTYYCRRHHGWVFLLWKTSTILPSFAKSFDLTQHSPLPDQERRKRTSCGDDPFDKSKRTHHFHMYPKAVDSSQLNPPFHRASWEVTAQRKQRRRKITSINLDDLSDLDDEMNEDPLEEHAEGELLDLYVCCQCSLYCLASAVMPGVIALKYVEDFTKYRNEHPAVGKSSAESVISGWETLTTYAFQFCLW
jgi:ubiquitin carboxyl-terminal hydrolase 25/28